MATLGRRAHSALLQGAKPPRRHSATASSALFENITPICTRGREGTSHEYEWKREKEHLRRRRIGSSTVTHQTRRIRGGAHGMGGVHFSFNKASPLLTLFFGPFFFFISTTAWIRVVTSVPHVGFSLSSTSVEQSFTAAGANGKETEI